MKLHTTNEERVLLDVIHAEQTSDRDVFEPVILPFIHYLVRNQEMCDLETRSGC